MKEEERKNQARQGLKKYLHHKILMANCKKSIFLQKLFMIEDLKRKKEVDKVKLDYLQLEENVFKVIEVPLY